MTANAGTQLGYGGPEFIGIPCDLQVPVTAFSITPTASLTILNPAGTLATGTFTLPANPFDGQLVALATAQTVTALTVAAQSGQTIGNPAVTTLVAGNNVAWSWKASASTWFLSPLR